MARVAGNPARVDGALKRGHSAVPPILAVSVGTAGDSRNWRFIQRMTDTGRLTRIRAAIICDYNDGAIQRMRMRIRSTLGVFKKQTHSSLVVMPATINTTDGFMLNPYAFHNHLGTIDEDLDKQVEQVRQQSLRLGGSPKLIIEFLGFRGHATVGLMLHEK